eukprot:m.155568 g.155568  ORF g.155568 m.155568 type:complete len:736 (+) comp15146_c3_seq3:199-2406(+)
MALSRPTSLILRRPEAARSQKMSHRSNSLGAYDTRTAPTKLSPKQGSLAANLMGLGSGYSAAPTGPRPGSPVVKSVHHPGTTLSHVVFGELISFVHATLHRALHEESADQAPAKLFQLGAGQELDHYLAILEAMASTAFPQLLDALLSWRRGQNPIEPELTAKPSRARPANAAAEDQAERIRERATIFIDFFFCHVLLRLLKAPNCKLTDDAARHLARLCMANMLLEESLPHTPAADAAAIAELFSRVFGALTQLRFLPVTKTFLDELERRENPDALPPGLVLGARFVMLRLYPMDELDRSFGFLKSCLRFSATAKTAEARAPWSAMFAELLRPVAAAAKSEVNVPAVRSVMLSLLPDALELLKRKKHAPESITFLTTVLAVSTREVFLEHWPGFVVHLIGCLKHKPVVQLAALECLAKLLWVYVIRVRGESNQAVEGRLRAIVDPVFPLPPRPVLPDAPLHFFTHMAATIAVEYQEFVFSNIIVPLLTLETAAKTLHPERAIIALRTLLAVIARQEHREGPPPFEPADDAARRLGKPTQPTPFAPLGSDALRRLRMDSVIRDVRPLLARLVRALDFAAVRGFMLGSEAAKPRDEGGERRRLGELLVMVLHVVPRLYPLEQGHSELVEFLCRCSLHTDAAVRALAATVLTGMVRALPMERASLLSAHLQLTTSVALDGPAACTDVALGVLTQMVSGWVDTLAQPDEDERPAPANGGGTRSGASTGGAANAGAGAG